MKVLVDTNVWSLALRRKTPPNNIFVDTCRQLIEERRVQMLGAIRQEILSGIREDVQFQKLKQQLSVFSDLKLEAADYERAAEIFNIHRRQGIQGSSTDFLICAVSERYNMSILTNDKDFELFQQHISIQLYEPQ